MMMRRRRPLARAAIVGGTAYAVGRRGAQKSQAEADQNAQIEELQQQQYQQQAAPPPAPAGGLSDEAIQQLQQLGQLKEQGILTDEEFEAQKKKLLGMA